MLNCHMGAWRMSSAVLDGSSSPESSFTGWFEKQNIGEKYLNVIWSHIHAKRLCFLVQNFSKISQLEDRLSQDACLEVVA